MAKAGDVRSGLNRLPENTHPAGDHRGLAASGRYGPQQDGGVPTATHAEAQTVQSVQTATLPEAPLLATAGSGYQPQLPSVPLNGPTMSEVIQPP